MHRTISTIAVLALACGGATEPGPLDEQPTPELGELPQPVEYVANYGFRDDRSTGQTRCLHNPTDNTHTCHYPEDKIVTMRTDGEGMSAEDIEDVEALLDGFIARFADEAPSWTLRRETFRLSNVNIHYGELPDGPETSIHTYVDCEVRQPGPDLEDFGGIGSYRMFGFVDCTIDEAKIRRDFSTQEEPRVLSHAVDYAAHKGWGIGSGGHFNRSYSIAVTPDRFKNEGLSAKVRCMLETFDPTFFPDRVFPACGFDFVPCLCADLADD